MGVFWEPEKNRNSNNNPKADVDIKLVDIFRTGVGIGSWHEKACLHQQGKRRPFFHRQGRIRFCALIVDFNEN